MFLSLFGFAWLGFGVHFILRFLALAYDPFLFQASPFPISLLPDEVLSRTWFYAAIYWVFFCLGFLFVLYRLPKRMPRILLRLNLFGSIENIKVLDLLLIINILSVILTNIPEINVPAGLLTPLGYLGFLYVIPATVGWFLHFRDKRIGLRRFIYMFPGIVLYFLSPYREHIITLALCIIIPAMTFKRQISFKKIVLVLIILLLISTIITTNYRAYLWEQINFDKTTFSNSWEYWNEKPDQFPWVLLINRFHSFDSMALTVYAVPDIFPYSERNIITETFVRAFLPRAIYYGKKSDQRGREFSTNIWALGERGNIISRSSAMIAPSMPGDLFSVNGILMIVLGALLWGFLAGFLERWIRILMGQVGGCVLIAIFGLRVAEGIERDFVNASANFIHIIIILLLLVAILPLTVKKNH